MTNTSKFEADHQKEATARAVASYSLRMRASCGILKYSTATNGRRFVLFDRGQTSYTAAIVGVISLTVQIIALVIQLTKKK